MNGRRLDGGRAKQRRMPLQGLKPRVVRGLMSELKLRPPRRSCGMPG